MQRLKTGSSFNNCLLQTRSIQFGNYCNYSYCRWMWRKKNVGCGYVLCWPPPPLPQPLRHRTTAAHSKSTHKIITHCCDLRRRPIIALFVVFGFSIFFFLTKSGESVWPYNFYCWLGIEMLRSCFVGKWKSHKISANCYFHLALCRNCKIRDFVSFFQPIVLLFVSIWVVLVWSFDGNYTFTQ